MTTNLFSLLGAISVFFIAELAHSADQVDPQPVIAGTIITFEKANDQTFGSVTVVEGVFEIIYFDGTSSLVKMGKFPVLKATAVTDALVVLDKTELKVLITPPKKSQPEIIDKSRSKTTKWYDRSGWN